MPRSWSDQSFSLPLADCVSDKVFASCHSHSFRPAHEAECDQFLKDGGFRSDVRLSCHDTRTVHMNFLSTLFRIDGFTP